MQQCFYNTNLQSMRVNNMNLVVYSVYESIVIDKISVNGITNFGIDIKNNSGAGNITNVALYGSADGVEYYCKEDNVYLNNIGPGELKHIEFNFITGFLRVTVQTDADINIDVYVHGNIT